METSTASTTLRTTMGAVQAQGISSGFAVCLFACLLIFTRLRLLCQLIFNFSRSGAKKKLTFKITFEELKKSVPPPPPCYFNQSLMSWFTLGMRGRRASLT